MIKTSFDWQQTWTRASITALCGALLLTSGCVSLSVYARRSAAGDHDMHTGMTPSSLAAPDGASDGATLRNAVVSADLKNLHGKPLPWANASTGSAGVIDSIIESNATGRTCREFRSVRHSYEGIALFSGQACLTGQGDWQLLHLQRAG